MPHKYVGIWWGMHLGTQTWDMGERHGATTENAIRYIDFAVENNIQGVMFEGWNKGWEDYRGPEGFDYVQAYDDFDIDSIVAYARQKGLALWAHNETAGNIPNYESQLEKAFAYYGSLGIHVVKTGYAGAFTNGFYHHSQYGVRQYTTEIVDANDANYIHVDNNQDAIRKIVRMERRVELCCEGLRWDDIRRWKDAENLPEMTGDDHGMNFSGTNAAEFYVRTVYQTRVWKRAYYWFPIYINEMEKNPNLVQSPYWN